MTERQQKNLRQQTNQQINEFFANRYFIVASGIGMVLWLAGGMGVVYNGESERFKRYRRLGRGV